MTIRLLSVGCLLAGFAYGCSDSGPEPMVDPTPPVVIRQIPNGGFEEGFQGWTIAGDNDAVKVVTGGCEGASALLCESAAPCQVSVSQTVEGLEDGLYDLEFYYKNSGGQTASYVAVGTTTDSRKMTSLQASAYTWTRSYVRGIQVAGGKCTVSIQYESEREAWSRLDRLNLIQTEKEFNLLKGGDISQLSYIEKMGGKFYENGQEKDCIEILKDNGWNIVRLRLYNDPGNADHSPSNRLPKGVQDAEDVLKLAKRAKQAGMQIQLTFHYSDYWTNPGTQYKPHAWEGLNYDNLKKALYDFTFDFMNRMKAQGTTPEFVSVGNETNAGLLFPDANYEHYDRAAELFSTGYDAVKAVSPDTKVIIHLSNCGDKSLYSYFFGEMAKFGAKYDIIGTSYYPFWTGKTAGEMREWANYIAQKFDKDILIMETGYNWNPTLPSGYPGQLSDNGPYNSIYSSSPLGQKNFMLELFNEMKKVNDGRVLGCLYWDPVFIEVPGVGWELGAENLVSNTTLFDFSGNRLEVLDTFKYNN